MKDECFPVCSFLNVEKSCLFRIFTEDAAVRALLNGVEGIRSLRVIANTYLSSLLKSLRIAPL